jgi:hypothetical protein
MEPRFRGAKVILVRSFARIHETNLKKQGVLPLTFADPSVYDQIGEDDKLSFLGLADLAPGKPVRAEIVKPDGSTVGFLRGQLHTMNDEQIEWFRGRRPAPQHHPPEDAAAAEVGAPPAEEAPGTPDTPDTDPTVDTDQAADTDPTDGTDAKRADERDPGAGTDSDAGSSAGDAPEG